jgi:hypothetical protein
VLPLNHVGNDESSADWGIPHVPIGDGAYPAVGDAIRSGEKDRLT